MKPEVVFNGQTADRSICCIEVISGMGSRVPRVRLCGFRHISTSRLDRNGCRWPMFAGNARITLRNRQQTGA